MKPLSACRKAMRTCATLAAVSLAVALVAPAAAVAQTGEVTLSPAERVIAALQTRGYRILLQERTFFGRLRIVAENAEHRREVVINPGTGELLRDYAVRLDGRTRSGEGRAVAGSGNSVASAAGSPVASGGDGQFTTALEPGASGQDVAEQGAPDGGVDMPSSGDEGALVVPDPLFAD